MSNVTPLRAGDHRRVGRYRLTGRIDGRPGTDGSTPQVFQAKAADGGTVIVTLLAKERAAGNAARDRFAAEARVARRVAPFCAARILDAGIEGDDPYLVTEYVPGLSLAEVVGSEGPLPGPALHALAIGAATGLAAIHQTGLVHGVFGPDHVVLGPDGPRVTHFSITPPYGPATPAADMLAWAHTITFAAVGRPPVGPQDLASHSSKGLTKRTEVMFGPAGHAYVYLVYGMYEMFNIVVGKTGSGQAVLIRSAEPLDGWKADLSGPGKLTRALKITRSVNGRDLTRDTLYLVFDPDCRPRVRSAKRIGVEYAGKWKDKLLRFFDDKSTAATHRPVEYR